MLYTGYSPVVFLLRASLSLFTLYSLCFSGPYHEFQVLLSLCSPPSSLFFP